MRIFGSAEDMKKAIGDEIGVSDWVEITQERIDLFAEATGDFQWIHVDAERAERESPFRTTRCCRCSSNRSCASTGSARA